MKNLCQCLYRDTCTFLEKTRKSQKGEEWMSLEDSGYWFDRHSETCQLSPGLRRRFHSVYPVSFRKIPEGSQLLFILALFFIICG